MMTPSRDRRKAVVYGRCTVVRVSSMRGLTAQWHGRAELLDANGGVIAEVAATLWKLTQRGRGVRWGGHVETQAVVDRHLPSAETACTLRLDSGELGDVRSYGPVQMDLSGVRAMERVEVLGHGSAPF
jgi:hypothetical protein